LIAIEALSSQEARDLIATDWGEENIRKVEILTPPRGA
jgi:hypothetical protein